MGSMWFHATPKGDLPQYSYIFKKTEPLGMEMNNMDCSRLGTMLLLEIQKGEEAMKTPIKKIYTIGTAACMKRLTMNKRVWTTDIKWHLILWYLVQWSENGWGGGGWGSILLRAGEGQTQGFLSSYIIKVDEILAGRVCWSRGYQYGVIPQDVYHYLYSKTQDKRIQGADHRQTDHRNVQKLKL